MKNFTIFLIALGIIGVKGQSTCRQSDIRPGHKMCLALGLHTLKFRHFDEISQGGEPAYIPPTKQNTRLPSRPPIQIPALNQILPRSIQHIPTVVGPPGANKSSCLPVGCLLRRGRAVHTALILVNKDNGVQPTVYALVITT